MKGVDHDKKSSILRMVVAKNAFGLYLKIAKPVYVRYQKQCEKPNSPHRAVNFAAATAAIPAT